MNNLKLIIACITLLCTSMLSAQEEIQVNSTIEAVTLYNSAAQIERVSEEFSLPTGTSTIALTGLPANTDVSSIRVKGKGPFLVLSISNRRDFDETMISNQEIELDSLISLQNKLQYKLNRNSAESQVLLEEEEMLKNNRNIIAPHRPGTVSELEIASNFITKRLTELIDEKASLRQKFAKINRQKQSVDLRINALNNAEVKSTYTALIKVKATKAVKGKMELSYLVGGASWFPSYDIRVKDVSTPLELIYKANILQNTGEDWTDVQLSLSNGDPTKSGLKPELQAYVLQAQNNKPKRGAVIGAYQNNTQTGNYYSGQVSGKVTDQFGESLIGVNIIVAGTTIGTVTDIDGNFNLQIPQGQNQLQISYIGYVTQTVPPQANLNIALQEDGVSLDEVVIVGYGTNSIKNLAYSVQNVTKAGGKVGNMFKRKRKVKTKNVSIVATSQNIQATVIEFDIKDPFTLLSDGIKYTLNIEAYDLPSNYEYAAVPKLDKNGFLFAEVTDWEDLNLLDGEANLFFEGKYLGKTVLQPANFSDTLALSLGRDQSIGVKRTKIKDFNKKQFLGNKRKVKRAFEIEIKNNKNETVEIEVEDQLPIARHGEIVVEQVELSNGIYSEKDGKVVWNYTLAPKESKIISLQYTVLYPKNFILDFE